VDVANVLDSSDQIGQGAAMARRSAHPDDPRDLIGEAYRMEGIGPEDCRSIFFDWALGLKDADAAGAAGRLLAHYADQPADHPMTGLLREAVEGKAGAKRRGGRRGRFG